jgi:hypothetical protein
MKKHHPGAASGDRARDGADPMEDLPTPWGLAGAYHMVTMAGGEGETRKARR